MESGQFVIDLDAMEAGKINKHKDLSDFDRVQMYLLLFYLPKVVQGRATNKMVTRSWLPVLLNLQWFHNAFSSTFSS